MEPVKLSVELRNATGKNENHRLRASAMIPAVLYGKKLPSISLKLNPRDLIKTMDPEKKRNTYFLLDIEGKEEVPVFIRDVQFDTMTGAIKHVDFLRTAPGDLVPATVNFRITGRSEGVKLGGSIRLTMSHLPVRCAAAEVPAFIEQDVTSMGLGSVLRVENLKLPEGLNIRLSPRQALVIVSGGKDDRPEEGAAAAPAPGAAPAKAAAAPAKAAPAKPAPGKK